jgi:hypothetical protein
MGDDLWRRAVRARFDLSIAASPASGDEEVEVHETLL